MKPTDLTKLKEVYEKYKHMNAILTDKQWVFDVASQARYDLWEAVKEVLDAETDNSSDNG